MVYVSSENQDSKNHHEYLSQSKNDNETQQLDLPSIQELEDVYNRLSVSEDILNFHTKLLRTVIQVC